MNYVYKVVENGFFQGVFMVDDNWQRYYGNFDFKIERFLDLKGMIDELYWMGFKVMLWVVFYVLFDSFEFCELEVKGYLLKDKNGCMVIIYWWNGYSVCYDIINLEVMNYLKEQLKVN